MFNKQTKTAGLVILVALLVILRGLGIVSFEVSWNLTSPSLWIFIGLLILILYIWSGNNIRSD